MCCVAPSGLRGWGVICTQGVALGPYVSESLKTFEKLPRVIVNMFVRSRLHDTLLPPAAAGSTRWVVSIPRVPLVPRSTLGYDMPPLRGYSLRGFEERGSYSCKFVCIRGSTLLASAKHPCYPCHPWSTYFGCGFAAIGFNAIALAM